MFPLNWNIPFIKKNGSRTTLGAITGDIAGIEEDIDDLTEKTDSLFDNVINNGAVNMCPNNATSKTDNEVTWTVNADKTITAVVASTVVASKELTLYINDDGSPNLVGKRVRLTGCPSGGSENTYRVHVTRAETTDGSTGSPIDYGNGIEFTWLNNGSGTKATVKIKIMEGCPAGTYVFKPMLSDPSLNLSYDDYVPYAKTNRELTEDVNHNLQSTSSVLAANDTKVFNIDPTKTLFGFTFSRYGCSMSWIGSINRLNTYNDPTNAQIAKGSNTSFNEQSVFFSAVYDSNAKTITLKILQLSSYFASGVQADFWEI